eukprot:10099714-Karenia_brevis.AAC.1
MLRAALQLPYLAEISVIHAAGAIKDVDFGPLRILGVPNRPPHIAGQGSFETGAIVRASRGRCVVLCAQVEGETWYCHAGSQLAGGEDNDAEDHFQTNALEVRDISSCKILGPRASGRAK